MPMTAAVMMRMRLAALIGALVGVTIDMAELNSRPAVDANPDLTGMGHRCHKQGRCHHTNSEEGPELPHCVPPYHFREALPSIKSLLVFRLKSRSE